MKRLTLFLNLLMAVSSLAQPALLEKWSSEQSFQSGLPPFKTIVMTGDGQWLLAGEAKNSATGHDIFTILLNPNTLQPQGQARWLKLPGNQGVHAAFPEKGCWLAGWSKTSQQKGAWLARLDSSGVIDYDTLFPAKWQGEFFDLIATENALLATGVIDGQTAVAVWQSGKAQLFLLPSNECSTQGMSIVQASGGDLFIVGNSKKGKEKTEMKVWQFKQSSGIFREVYSRPNATARAACKEFTGGVAVAAIGDSGSNREKLLLIRLEKRHNFLTDSIWSARETVLASFSSTLEVHDLQQLPGGSLVVAGGSSNYHPSANCTLFFTAAFDPISQACKVQHYEGKSGGTALAIARRNGQELLLAGVTGCNGKGNGNLLCLEREEDARKLPFSSLDAGSALPRVVMEESLHLNECLFDASSGLRVDSSFLLVNRQATRCRYQGEKIKFASPYNLFDAPRKDACKEYRLEGRIPLRPGMFDTIQLKSTINDVAYESTEHLVYRAPVLHLVAVGNNHDKVNPLQFADEDARSVAEFFKGQEGISFSKVVINLLDEEIEISPEKVANLLDSVAARRFASGDVFVFFMSSHCGVKDGRLVFPYRHTDKFGDFYMDFDSVIYAKIRKLPCRKLILIDACQARPDVMETMPVVPTNPDVLLVTGCQLDKKSYEHSDWGHGAFTLELLSALTGGAKATLHGSFTTPGDILKYLENNVPERVKNRLGVEQTPISYGGSDLLGTPFIFHPKN